MKETSEFLMTGKGDLIRRHIIEDEIDVTPEILAAFSEEVFRTAKNIFKIKLGEKELRVGGAFTKDESYMTIRLPSLPLKAPFKSHEGVCWPVFGSKNEPVLPLEWVTPEDMKLVLLVEMKHTPTISHTAQHQWLVAMDNDGHCYRLPLGNVYDDGGLCQGNDWPRIHETAQACMIAEIEQLVKGQWNGDLDNKPEQTRNLFRFKPGKKDTFEQLPPTNPWQSLSVKISTSIFKYIVL